MSTLRRAAIVTLLMCAPALARPGDELLGRWVPDGARDLRLIVARGQDGALRLERWAGRRSRWTSSRARSFAGKLWVDWAVPARKGRGLAGRLDGGGRAPAPTTLRAVYELKGEVLREWFPGRSGKVHRWRRPDGGTTDLPPDTVPPDRPEAWPLAVGNERFLVHYRVAGEEGEARRTLELLEQAWQREAPMGFRPPPADAGAIGPDARLDAFLVRGIDECYCDARDAITETAWDDQRTFLVIDPWGKYGGPELPATVAHELNHAMQAADDWFEPSWIFESTATLVERELFPEQVHWAEIVQDVQDHPEWGFGHDDNYETWFLYGQGLYLELLRHKYAGGKLDFLGELWLGMRSPAGAEDDPARNEPDVFDALEGWLKARGSSLERSLLEYARWRWYTGPRADGKHAPGADQLPPVKMAARRRPEAGSVKLAPEPFGAAYVELFREGNGDARKVRVTVEGAPPAGGRWALEALPGKDGADSELLDPRGAVVELGKDGVRGLVLVALPAPGIDADDEQPGPCPATLRFEAVE